MSIWRFWIAGLLCLFSWPAGAGEMEDRRAIGREAAAAFSRGDYGAIEERYAMALGKLERTGSGVLVADRLIDLMLGELWQEPAGGPARTRGRDGFWQPIEARARRWSELHPRSVLPVLALSSIYVSHGWDYRGEGYANTVAQEDWKQFRHYVGLAQDVLLRAQSQGRLDPNWHVQLLRVGRLSQWPEDRYWALAEAAMSQFPQHYEIYFEIAEALVPQWGGSLEQLASFAEQAAQRSAATDGRSLYARIYWAVYTYLSPEVLRSGKVDWAKVKAGFDDVVVRYPVPRNLNFYARMACDVQDKQTTRQLLERLKQNTDMEGWGDLARFNRCRQWAGM